MFNETIIQFKTNWVAVFGAVTGTVGLILSLLNFFRDRAKIKIIYRSEWKMIGQHEQYKNNAIYSEIRVINNGRRPVKIEKAGARVQHKEKWIMIIDPFWFSTTNRVLTEENPSTSIYWEKSLFNDKNIYYFQITDAAGRNYKKWLHFWRYLWHRITHIGKGTTVPARQ